MLTTVAVAESLAYPETARRPVSETYHGATVVDNYRWLEKDEAPEVKQWMATQMAAPAVSDGNDEEMSVFIISHHPSIQGRLDKDIRIVKENGFSSVVTE